MTTTPAPAFRWKTVVIALVIGLLVMSGIFLSRVSRRSLVCTVCAAPAVSISSAFQTTIHPGETLDPRGNRQPHPGRPTRVMFPHDHVWVRYGWCFEYRGSNYNEMTVHEPLLFPLVEKLAGQLQLLDPEGVLKIEHHILKLLQSCLQALQGGKTVPEVEQLLKSSTAWKTATTPGMISREQIQQAFTDLEASLLSK